VARLSDYFEELQLREGVSPTVSLTGTWSQHQTDSAIDIIKNAIQSGQIIGSEPDSFSGTNQSKGNKVAEFFFSKFRDHLPSVIIASNAKGAGYPDKLIKFEFSVACLELKATSNWKNSDSNRRVLTSSSKKIRKLILDKVLPVKPLHLIATVFYAELSGKIVGVRLDFMNPDTEINIRLEASTSQKLLANGPQATAYID
jgi:hypothetical protein